MPQTQPPGTSMLPVMAGSMARARQVWKQLGVCSTATPHSRVAGFEVAKRRAASRIFSAGTQVIPSAHAGVWGSTRSASCSKPLVQLSTNSRS